MTDALNMMALAKMAVVVIGIFLVPAITRKFAAALPQLGQSLKNFGRSLNQTLEPGSEDSYRTPSSPFQAKAGSALHKLGGFLEGAALRHQAKKEGVAPLSLKDRLLKNLSVDPEITGPIREKEQRYQRFLEARDSRSNSSSSVARGPSSHSQSSPQEKAHNGSQAVFSREHQKTSKDWNPGSNARHSNFRSDPHEKTPERSAEKQWLRQEVSKQTHRWLNPSKLNRLFNSQSKKEDS